MMRIFRKDSTKKVVLDRDNFLFHHDTSKSSKATAAKADTNKIPRFKDQYAIGTKLPLFRDTYTCTHKHSQDVRSVKIFALTHHAAFWKQLQIHQALNENRFFPNLYESFRDEKHFYLVTSSLQYDNLYDVLGPTNRASIKSKKWKCSTGKAVAAVKDVLEMLRSCHVMEFNGQTVSVSHGLINAKNLLYLSGALTDDTPRCLANFDKAKLDVVVLDDVQNQGDDLFGNNDNEEDDDDTTVRSTSSTESDSESIDEEEEESVQPKTPPKTKKTKPRSHYYSPQFLEEGASPKSDIYAVGVLAYHLLTGRWPPTDARAETETGRVNLDQLKKTTHQGLKNFISDALQVDPSDRPTAAHALDDIDRYDLNSYDRDGDNRMDEEDKAVVARLAHAGQQHKLQEAVSYYIAKQLMLHSGEERKALESAWEQMDRSNDESLTKDEVRLGFEEAGIFLDGSDLDAVFERMDLNKDGKVEFSEFLAAAADEATLCCRRKLKAAFVAFDVSQTGSINSDDLKAMFNRKSNDNKLIVNTRTAREMIRKADKDGDGELSFEEFAAMMEKTATNKLRALRTISSTESASSAAEDQYRGYTDFEETLKFKTSQGKAGHVYY